MADSGRKAPPSGATRCAGPGRTRFEAACVGTGRVTSADGARATRCRWCQQQRRLDAERAPGARVRRRKPRPESVLDERLWEEATTEACARLRATEQGKDPPPTGSGRRRLATPSGNRRKSDP